MSIELQGVQEGVSETTEVNKNLETPQNAIEEIMERGIRATEGELQSLASILKKYSPEEAQKILNETFRDIAKILLNKQIKLENPNMNMSSLE